MSQARYSLCRWIAHARGWRGARGAVAWRRGPPPSMSARALSAMRNGGFTPCLGARNTRANRAS